MTITKIPLYIILVFAITLFLIYRNPEPTPIITYPQPLENSQPELDVYKTKNITIVKFGADYQINLIENLDLETTENVSDAHNCKGVINGGYYLRNYVHAGYLKVDNTEKRSAAPQDPQLTHILSVQNPLQIIPISDIAQINSFTAFQTGPLILNQGNVQEDLIMQSLNGSGNYLRSAIGFTSNNELVLAISTVAIDLTTLSNQITALEELRETEITLINLDGGSSVSLFTESTEARYGIAKKLPFLLCIK